MKRLGGVIILLLFTTVAAQAAELQWMSLHDGLAKAKSDKRPMIVDFFYGKGCARCEALQDKVYSDPAIVKKIMTDFVPIRVDLSKKLTKEEEDFGNRFDYKNDCLLLFLDSDGNVYRDPGGKKLCFIDTVSPDWFMNYLDMVKAQMKK